MIAPDGVRATAVCRDGSTRMQRVTRRLENVRFFAGVAAWVAAAIAALSLAWWVVLGDATEGNRVTPIDIPDGTGVTCTVQDDRLVGCAVDLTPPAGMGVAL